MGDDLPREAMAAVGVRALRHGWGGSGRRRPKLPARGQCDKARPSGAGHDAQAIARLGPMGMICIPSVGGISHSPREYSRPGDITNGANVLLHALLKLDAAELA